MYGCFPISKERSFSPASMALFHMFPRSDESSTESKGKESGTIIE